MVTLGKRFHPLHELFEVSGRAVEQRGRLDVQRQSEQTQLPRRATNRDPCLTRHDVGRITREYSIPPVFPLMLQTVDFLGIDGG